MGIHLVIILSDHRESVSSDRANKFQVPYNLLVWHCTHPRMSLVPNMIVPPHLLLHNKINRHLSIADNYLIGKNLTSLDSSGCLQSTIFPLHNQRRFTTPLPPSKKYTF